MNKPSTGNPQDQLTQQSAYQEQQVLLFWLLAKILRRLARRIAWAELSTPDKRRLNTTLKTLEGDVHLVRTVICTRAVKRLYPRSEACRRCRCASRDNPG